MGMITSCRVCFFSLGVSMMNQKAIFYKIIFAIVFFLFAIDVLVAMNEDNEREMYAITFQGLLQSESSNHYGPLLIDFALYDSQFSNMAIWNEQHSILTKEGVFSVDLGSKNNLPEILPNQLWIGLSKDGIEFSRIRIAAVPFALNSHISKVADSVKGGMVKSINGVTGSITLTGSDGLEVRNTQDGGINIGLSESAKGEKTLNQGTEWLLGGNANVSQSNWFGTVRAAPLSIRTNSIERMRFSGEQTGFISINDPKPSAKFSVGHNIHIKSNGGIAELSFQTPNWMHNTTFRPTNQTSNINYVFPNSQGKNGTYLSTNDAGQLSWTELPSWGISGNSNVSSNSYLGTTSSFPLNIRTNNVERMTITENGLVGINNGKNSPREQLDITGNVLVKANSINPGKVIFEGRNGYYNSFRSEHQKFSMDYIFPKTEPKNGQVLSTNNLGQLSWIGISDSAYILNGNDFKHDARIGLNTPYDLIIETNNQDRMRIEDNGNISVNNSFSVDGTITPSAEPAGVNSPLSYQNGIVFENNPYMKSGGEDDKAGMRLYQSSPNTHNTVLNIFNGNDPEDKIDFTTPNPNNVTINGSTILTANNISSNLSNIQFQTIINSGNTYLGDNYNDITSLQGTFRVYDSDATNYTDIKGGDGTIQTANLNFVLPTNAGTSGQSLTTDGSGNLSWAATSPDWSAPGTIGSTTPNTASFTTLSASNNLSVYPLGSGSGDTGEIRWYELAANGTDYIAFKAPDNLISTIEYTLPATQGSTGQVLTNNGSGILSWSSISGSTITSLDDLIDSKFSGSNFSNSLLLGHEQTGVLNNAVNNNAVGVLSLENITSGDNNSALGYGALHSITSGTDNTAIGINAGYSTITGSGNVFIGSNAGYNETGSNSLYIDNSNTSTPLIKGDFASNAVTVHGSLGVTGATTMNSGTSNSYTLPTSRGTIGQYLMTDGAGNSNWSNITSIQGRPISNTNPANNNSLMWDSVNQTWKPGIATSSVALLSFSEGVPIDIDVIRNGTTKVNNINISENSLFRLINASAGCDISGFVNGTNGRMIYIINTSGSNQTFNQENTHSAPENRLILGVSNKNIGDRGTITFIYSSTLNRWIMVSST